MIVQPHPNQSQPTTAFSGRKQLWQLVFVGLNRQESYDYKIVRSGVAGALLGIWLLIHVGIKVNPC